MIDFPDYVYIIMALSSVVAVLIFLVGVEIGKSIADTYDRGEK